MLVVGGQSWLCSAFAARPYWTLFVLLLLLRLWKGATMFFFSYVGSLHNNNKVLIAADNA